MKRIVKIGDIAKVISGYAFKSSHFEEEGCIPVIKIKNIRFGYTDLADADYVQDSFASLDKKFHVDTGDILISLTGSHVTQPNSVVGRVGVYQAGLPKALLNQRAGKINPISELIHKKYLYFALLSENIRHEIAQMAHGAASQANVSPSQIESIEIFLPEIEQQKNIAYILSSYDELIANNNRRIAILEEMAQSLYREWFVKFRFPGYEKVKFIDSELGRIPEGWKVKKLDEVICIDRGRSYKSEELVEKGGYPFLNLKNISIEGGFRREGLKRYSGPFKPHQVAKANDIIMAVTDMTQHRAIIGRAARIPDMDFNEFIISMDLIKITVKENCNGNFIYSLLRYSNFPHEVKQFANGANVLHLNPVVVASYNAVIPTNNLMDNFSNIMQPIYKTQDKLAKKNDNLKMQRDLLLPKLISENINLNRS